MKKVLKVLFLAGLFMSRISSEINAQQLLNGGFENWANQSWGGIMTTSEPENWMSTNYSMLSLSNVNLDTVPVQISSDSYEGLYSVQLNAIDIDSTGISSVEIYGMRFYDYASLAEDFSLQTLGTNILDSVVFYYKFHGSTESSIASIDAVVGYDSLMSGGNFIGGVPAVASYHIIDGGTNNSSEWTRKSVPLEYDIIPEDELFFSIHFRLDGSTGSTLKIDAIELKFNNSLVGLVQSDESKLNIFPNPASEKINLEFEAQNEDYTISIIDLQGRVLLTEMYSNLSGSQNVELRLNELSSGKYLVTVESESTKTIEMIVVE